MKITTTFLIVSKMQVKYKEIIIISTRAMQEA